MRVRTATAGDEPFLLDLCELFSPLGDYRTLLPGWFRMAGVHTFVCEVDGARAGCAMLAFFEEDAALVADLLAIGVAPAFQDRGVGHTLVQHTVAVCERVAQTRPVRALRLSVAATNAPARRLFASCGFVEVEGELRLYDGGQVALFLERGLDGSRP